MKKTFITIATTLLLMGGTTAYAATNTASVDQLIAQLQAQIATLMTQLNALKSAQATVSTSQTSINETLSLIGNLKEGMSGEQVLLLQTALASDPDIYPEGEVSGYYGKLTTQAIKRFQKKYNLSQTGSTGNETTKELNKLLKKHQLSRERDRDDDDGRESKKIGRFCIPPGHAVASGWLKKTRESSGKGHGNGNTKWTNDGLLIPFCNTKNGSTTPNTNDTVAPLISSPGVTAVNSNGATITWTTNENTRGSIYVGTTSPVGTSSAIWSQGSFTLGHSAALSGLSANTVYYFIVKATDGAGNATLATQGTFTTSVGPDTVAPVITNVLGTSTSKTTATVSWTTNENASSKVYFGTTTPVLTGAATALFDGALVTAHQLSIAGLISSTTYYAVVESRDTANNFATSSQISFVTPSI